MEIWAAVRCSLMNSPRSADRGQHRVQVHHPRPAGAARSQRHTSHVTQRACNCKHYWLAQMGGVIRVTDPAHRRARRSPARPGGRRRRRRRAARRPVLVPVPLERLDPPLPIGRQRPGQRARWRPAGAQFRPARRRQHRDRTPAGTDRRAAPRTRGAAATRCFAHRTVGVRIAQPPQVPPGPARPQRIQELPAQGRAVDPAAQQHVDIGPAQLQPQRRRPPPPVGRHPDRPAGRVPGPASATASASAAAPISAAPSNPTSGCSGVRDHAIQPARSADQPRRGDRGEAHGTHPASTAEPLRRRPRSARESLGGRSARSTQPAAGRGRTGDRTDPGRPGSCWAAAARRWPGPRWPAPAPRRRPGPARSHRGGTAAGPCCPARSAGRGRARAGRQSRPRSRRGSSPSRRPRRTICQPSRAQ